MAFRDDEAALHARIESLERELAEARTELARLSEIEAERDRLKLRLEALEPKKPVPAGRQAERSRAEPGRRSTPSFGLPVPRTPQAMVLAVLVAILVFGLITYLLAERSTDRRPLAATPKPADARPPTIGVVDLSATPEPVPIAFTVTGTGDAPDGCAGHLPDAPQLVLRTTTPALLRVTTQCDVDLVLVLTGTPAGVLCDDDSGEDANPLIQTMLPPGEARLTIGTYSSGNTASCAIELHASPLAPGVDEHGLASGATPRLGTVSTTSAETSFDGVVAGALIEADAAQRGCPGVIGSVPDLALDVSEPSIVRVDVASGRDLVLMMRSPDGSFTCDDDDGVGTNPRIAKRVPPGHYAVWVGAYDASGEGASFHAGVRVTTLAEEARVVVPTLDLVDGSPTHVTGTSSDEVSASTMWSDCTSPGFVPYEPQVTLRLAARRDVVVADPAVTRLLAIVPRDAASARRPSCVAEGAWRGTLDPGAYDLYVGVPSGDDPPGPFDLTITTSGPSVLPYTRGP